MLPGWWVGENDNRVDAPYISVDRWRNELHEAGFQNVHSAPGEAEIYMTSILASIPSLSHSENSTVNILYDSQPSPWEIQVAQRIEALGFPVRWCTLSESPPGNEDVISFLDIESPYLYSLTDTQLVQLQQYLSSCTSTRVLWVTRSSQMCCPDPRYGLTLGFARTMRMEYEMDFDTIEVEDFDQISEDAIVKTYVKFQQQRFRTDETADHEYAVQDGVIHIPRYHWSSLSENLLEDPSPEAPKTLAVEQPGILDSLKWVEKDSSVIGENQVEIDVKFVGLNFRVRDSLAIILSIRSLTI